MRIAFVSQWDTDNVHAWSGTPYYMAKAMEKFGVNIEKIDSVRTPFNFYYKIVRYVHKVVGKHYDVSRQPSVAKSYAKQIKTKLAEKKFDIVFSPGSILLAYLDTPHPKVFWTDATFASMVGYYPDRWSRLSALTVKNGNETELRAINNVDLAIYASDWAAYSAFNNYQANSRKVAVIPFGANVEYAPSADLVVEAINKRSLSQVHIIFIGVDWHRKGGDLVMRTAEVLRHRGIDVVVDVVGCEPLNEVPSYVRLHGFVTKRTEAGRKLIEELLLQAHFLFVPSLAECYGMVYAEAAAYGVIPIASATGGVTTVIRHGVCGYALPPGSTADKFADVIQEIFIDRKKYLSMAMQAREDFEKRLNWDEAIKSLVQQLDTLLNSTQAMVKQPNS